MTIKEINKRIKELEVKLKNIEKIEDTIFQLKIQKALIGLHLNK